MTKLLTLAEIADRLRKSQNQVRWMRQQGTGPRTAVIGGRLMARESDVEAWIEAQFSDDAEVSA